MDTKLFVRRQPGGMFTIVDRSMVTGSVFYVSSGTGTDAAGFGLNPDAPVVSLAYAGDSASARMFRFSSPFSM